MNSTARIDDPKGVERVVTLYAQSGHLWTARFSPDGQTVLTAGERGIKLFSVADSSLSRAIDASGVMSAGYSPDGSKFLTADRYGNLIVWDTATGDQKFSMKGLNVACTDCAAFSPDGKVIAAGTVGGVSIFDAGTGAVLSRTSTS